MTWLWRFNRKNEEGEDALSGGLEIINNFFKRWSLNLSLAQTEVS